MLLMAVFTVKHECQSKLGNYLVLEMFLIASFEKYNFHQKGIDLYNIQIL